MQRVLILGGGCAGVAAAEALTATAQLRSRCAVTLVEASRVLGGKGASVRHGDQKTVLEHGLHLWPGWYANAFAMMRTLYEERPPAQHGLNGCFDAFRPLSRVTLWERAGLRPEPWNFCYPTNSGLPGDGAVLPSTLELVVAAAKAGLAATLGAEAVARWQHVPGNKQAPRAEWPDRFTPGWQRLRSLAQRFGSSAAQPAFISTVELLQHALRIAPSLPSTTSRRVRIIVDLALAQLHGLLQSNVLTGGLDDLDHEEWSAWLARHGAEQQTLDSPLVAGAYGALFSYRNGEMSQPAVSAGVMTRFGLRMAGSYRGSVLWRMQGGMGDVVFAPAWQALSARGVDLRLATAVRRIETVDGCVVRIHLRQSASLRDGHDVLSSVHGTAVWSDSELGWVQKEQDYVLERGTDFDEVILAIPPAALGDMLHAVSEQARSWLQLSTVATMSEQLWLKRTPEELGYHGAPAVHGHLEGPLDTWADLSHILAHEDWGTDSPAGLIYACGALSERADASERDRFSARLDDGLRWAMPQLSKNDVVRRYRRLNVHGSERYHQSLPGQVRLRPRVTDTGLSNLLVVGDWVRTGIDAGCVEAAVVSGRQAARALTGNPICILGEGR